MDVQAKDLKEPYIFDNQLSDEEKNQVVFDIYINGQKGNKQLSYYDFIGFLDMYHVDHSSNEAALLECGVEMEVPEGMVRFDRIYPEKIDMPDYNVMNIKAGEIGSNYGERPLTINKGHVVAHAWRWSNEVENLDFSKHLQLIADTFKSLADAPNKPKLLAIEGAPGSGKSILGQVLAEDGSNAEFIPLAHLAEKHGLGFGELDVSAYMADPSKTYILDDVAYASKNPLIAAIQEHAQSGGVAVLLIQDVRDIHPGLLRYMTVFHLGRDEFRLKISGE